MDTDFQKEHIFFHDKPNKTNITDDDDDVIMNTDELQNSNNLVIENIFPEEEISCSPYSIICGNLYNDIKSTIKYQIMS